MPEVQCIHNLCADKPLYEFSNYTLFGCNVSPNIITGINTFIFTPLILYNLIYNGSYIYLAVLTFIRIYLDVLDGSIARKCKLQSKFGSLFDLIGDFILHLGIILIVLYFIYNNGKHNIYLSVVACLIIFFILKSFVTQLIDEINIYIGNSNNTKRHIEVIDTIMADNSVIMIFILIFAAKVYINYLSLYNK